MKKSIVFTVAFCFLFVGGAVTPVRADCPHKDNFNHKHCDNVPTDIMVVDSSDPPKQVGELLTINSVAFSVDGRVIRLSLNRHGWQSKDPLYFESDDCGVLDEDDALHLTTLQDVYAVAIISTPGNTVYVERAGTFANRDTLSLLNINGICDPAAGFIDTIIVDPVVNLDDLFIPPFEVVGDAPTLP